MTRALDLERTKFIELLVMNGFVMRSFLTVEKLRELYNDSVSNSTPIMSILQLSKFLNIHHLPLVVHCKFQKFKELRLQLKAMTGFTGNTIFLRQIHRLLIAIAKDHNYFLYKSDKPHRPKVRPP